MTSFDFSVTELSETFTRNNTTGDGRCFFHALLAGLKKIGIDCGDTKTLMMFLGVDTQTFEWTRYDFEELYPKVVALFGVTLAVYYKPQGCNKYRVFVYTPSEVSEGTVYLHLTSNHYEWMSSKLEGL